MSSGLSPLNSRTTASANTRVTTKPTSMIAVAAPMASTRVFLTRSYLPAP